VHQIKVKRSQVNSKNQTNEIMRSKQIFIASLITVLAFLACKENVELANVASPKDYYALAVGKYRIYRLDSIITVNFNTGFTTRSYQMKDSFESKIVDATGKETFRVYRYIRNLAGTAAWRNAGTYYVTLNGQQIETVEDNQRVIRLKFPVLDSVTWKGAAYSSYSPFYTNSFYLNWLYRYTNLNQSRTFAGKTYTNTITIRQADSTNSSFGNIAPLGLSVINGKVYSSYNKGYEVYAKDLGLIYKDIIDWEYQPRVTIDTTRNPPDTTFRPNYEGFGIKLTLLESN
jgi:hypothetical protein